MKIFELFTDPQEGVGQSIKQAFASPTAKGIGDGLGRAFGTSSGNTASTSSGPSQAEMLQGIDTGRLKSVLDKISKNQTIAPDEIEIVKKLLQNIS